MRPEAIASLKGVDKILHAGDIGDSHVLEILNQIAPVVAVRGNNDKGKWAEQLPDWEALEIDGVSVYMLHDLKEISINPAGLFQVVISGHSHQPSVVDRRGVLYVNPGSAGPKRFKLPVSVALLTVKGPHVDARLIELSV